MDGLIQMLPAPLRKFSTHHDFPGQKLAERTYQIILIISGIIGFFVGYSTQQLSHAIFAVLVGGVVASLAVLPPWPVFRKHPLKWQNVSVAAPEESKKTK